MAGPGSISMPPLLPSSSTAPHSVQALLPLQNNCLRPSGVLDAQRGSFNRPEGHSGLWGGCAKPRAFLLPPAPNTPTSFLSPAPLRAFPTPACRLSQESQGTPTLGHALAWVCIHVHTRAPAHTSFSPLCLLLNPTHYPVCHQGPGHGHPPARGLCISWKKASGAFGSRDPRG